MAAPVTTSKAVIDNFNRADGALGTNWGSPMVSGDPAPVVHSNVMTQRSGDALNVIVDSAYWKTAFTGGRYEAFGIDAQGSGWIELWFMTSQGNGYALVSSPYDSPPTFGIYKIVGGTYTLLKNYATAVLSGSGEVPYFFMENEGGGVHLYAGTAADGVGQTITYLLNIADSSFGNINTVYTGVRLGSATWSSSATWGEGCDNFHAGAVASVTTVIAPPATFTASAVAPTLTGATSPTIPTFVNYMSAGAIGGTTITCPPTNVGEVAAVGDLLILSFYQPNASNNVSSVTDTQGNTWTFVNRNTVSPGNLASDIEQWYCVVQHALTNADLVTVTVPASQANKSVIISHFTGCSSTPFDKSSATSVSNNATIGTINSAATPATTQAVELVIGMFAMYMGSAIQVPPLTPGSGYTSIGWVNYGPTNSIALFAEYKTVTSIGTQQAGFSYSGSNAILQIQSLVGTYKAQTAVSATVVAPPATFSGSAVAPVLVESPTIITPPAQFTAQSVAPPVTVSVTIVGQGPGVVSMNAIAPVVTGTALVVSPVALFLPSVVAPLIIISPIIATPPATFTASSVAPLPIRSLQLVSTPGVFTAGAVAPLPTVSLTIFPNAIGLTANQMGSIPVVSVLPNASVFTASAVAPFPFLGIYCFAVPARWTAASVAPALVETLSAPAAILTGSSVAPIITKTLLPNAAVATYSSVQPLLSIVLPTAVSVATYSSVAPSFIAGTGLALSVPAATFAASSVSPGTSLLTGVPPAQFTASSATPALIETLLAVPALWTASSVAPLPTRSPLVITPSSTATMSSVAPLIALAVTPGSPQFTAGAQSPILSNVLGVTFGVFTASAPVVKPGFTQLPPAAQATFTSVGGQLFLQIQIPAGGWIASTSMPSLTILVPTPAGNTTFSGLVSLNIEKKQSVTTDRATFSAVAPGLQIRIQSPAALFIAGIGIDSIGGGVTAGPADVQFSISDPSPQVTSQPAIYYYRPGPIIESDAWSMHQH